jgi:hypothetical protein
MVLAVKRPGLESAVEVKNEWSYTPIPQYNFKACTGTLSFTLAGSSHFQKISRFTQK